MSSGITLQELNRLFEFLKQSKTNDEMTVLITNDMCKSLYNLMENCVEYQDKLQSNWNSLRELIKWKPIEEYDENKYDWVLVKYYDGDYECVPRVAERRKGTNKWYDTNNNEIIFEVKYFFDMQLLDKMNELEGKNKE